MRLAAFTLVELLVVISILAMLMAVVFPVFASSREQAQMIACRTNIHGLLVGLHNYEAEYQALPYGFDFKDGAQPPGGHLGFAHYNLQGWWWFHLTGMVRHRKEVDAIRCPSKKLEDPILNRDVLCGNYGVNRALCRVESPMISTPFRKAFAGPPVSTSAIRHPGSTLLIVDSGYTLISWWQATANPPGPLDDFDIESTAYVPGLEINKNRALWPGQSCDAVGGRHPNKTVNVGFADGHADPQEASELLVEKTEDGSYTNTALWYAQ